MIKQKNMLLGVAIAATTSSTLYAQTTLEEIIVTARKTSESILEIPVSVTAFTADDIEEIDLRSIGDLQYYTPGFNYQSFGTTVGRLDNVPRFRGVTVNSGAPTRQPASVFIDGVFVANGVQGINFGDIERIEAIKGPQSAVFGRSTFGGAINFITKDPGDELAFDIEASIASQSYKDIAGSIEGSIMENVKGRISANLQDKEGHHTSSVDGGSLGDEETWSLSGTLVIDPAENFSIKLRANYFENDDGAAAAILLGQDVLNCGPTSFEADANFPGIVAGQAGPVGGSEGFICGTIPTPTNLNIPTIVSPGLQSAIAGLTEFNGAGSRRANDGFGLDRQSLRFSAQFDWDINENMALSYVYGKNSDEVNQLRPGEGNALGGPAFYATNSRQFDDVSHEIRLSGSAGDNLNWSFGANHFDQELASSGVFGLFSGGFNFSDGTGNDLEEIKTTGIFGSLDIDVSDKLAVTLEARYQKDDISDDDDATDTNPGFQDEFTSFLPRLTLEYTPFDGGLAYLSYSEGNLPGGFNNEVIAFLRDETQANIDILFAGEPRSQSSFQEEELEQIELGYKQSYERGSLAVAAYYIDRTNQTVRQTVLLTLTDNSDDFVTQFLNIGKSEVYGLELEGLWKPNDALTIDARLSYVDSTLLLFESNNALRALGDDDVAGFTSERYPEWQGSLSWQYEANFNDQFDWYVRNDNSYTGEYYSSEVNLAEASSALIANLRVGLKSDSMRIELYGTNLTDEDAPISAARNTDLGSVVTRTNGNRPFGFQYGLRDKRQFGIRVSSSF